MRTKGFTLVEILIVVVILGILAAIVIPQFTGASTEAKEAQLLSNLQSMRAQIELYKIQHNDLLPGEVYDTGTGITAPATAITFVNAMCNKTDQYGNVGTDPAVHIYGRYVKRIPVNKFSNASGEIVAGLSEDDSSVAVSGIALPTGGDTTAWNFVCTTLTDPDYGHFQAADSRTNPTDTGYLHVEY